MLLAESKNVLMKDFSALGLSLGSTVNVFSNLVVPVAQYYFLQYIIQTKRPKWMQYFSRKA